MRILILCLLSIILLVAGCEQYQYASPSPGTLEVRLRTKSENVPYNSLNLFIMELTDLRAVRADSAKLEVYQDLMSINRSSPTDFNAFDSSAYDSEMVLGEAYAPPGNYVGLDLIAQPVGQVVLDGYRYIPVDVAPDFQTLALLRSPFKVNQSGTTIITVTFEVDSSLTKGAESFHYNPDFYISSIIEQ